jgi:hypothetical protein
MKLIKSVPGFIMLVSGTVLMIGAFIWIYFITSSPLFYPLLLIIAGVLFIAGIILMVFGWRKSV